MENAETRQMKYRLYRTIPVEAIRIVNSRGEEEQLLGNMKNIDRAGFLKPVMVNERFFRETGKYELVYGKESYFAHKQLGRRKIAAEVISCSRRQAYLISLVESPARLLPGSMRFEREIKRLCDNGMSHKRVAEIIGKSEAYVAGCVNKKGGKRGEC